VSTLDALFSGRKELFEGLFIYDKWDWSQQYPVIRIDWTLINHSTLEKMENSLCKRLCNIAKKYNVRLESETAVDCFLELIELMEDTTGKKVVILIDEYDKPVTSHLFDSDFKDFCNAVHDFYQVMKGADEYLQFIFLTGVSKFSGLSVFSALNNPNDITLDRKYVSICGYTQEELEYYFTDYIDEVAKFKNQSRDELLDNIRTWYNGYSWDGETSVYNPFSTLLLFDKKDFANYWFQTGTPTFLMDTLLKRNQIQLALEPVAADSSVFGSYDPDNIDEIPLLVQTGYLTIKSVTAIEKQGNMYTLDIPNLEVRNSFTKYLFNAYSKYPLTQIQPLISDMQKQIYNGDTSGLEQNMRVSLAHIPNILHVDNEAYYHSLFLLLMKVLGFDIQGEIMTNIGRIDAVWKQADLTVVAEIKYSSKKDIDKLLKEAMTQICKRKYYEAYLNTKVVLIAVAFTGKEVKCKMKRIDK
jgi:hypothetical protein